MEAADLRRMFDTVLPHPKIQEAIKRLGVQQRRRELDPIALVFSLVLMGGTWETARIATAVRDYFDRGGTRVVAGAYYKWFDAELLALMKELSGTALAYAASMPKHLPGILAGRRDWRAVDSTVVKLANELASVWPGTGEYAALKVHKVYSLGVENVVGYHITPARNHDGPELTIDESWRGMGLIVDLGYAAFRLLRECQAHDVHVVMRLKEKWGVYVDDSVDAATKARWVGVDAGAVHGVTALEMDGSGPLDVDVTVGPEDAPIRMRLVGVQMEKEYGLFLTNLPRSTHTHAEVGMIYRLRWGIEVDNKLSKTACQLDEITAERQVSAEILVHAAMIASVIANAIVHLDHLDQGAVGAKTVLFTRPPLHPILVWKCVVAGAHRLAEMLADPATPDAAWLRVAANLTGGGADRNWKRTPSAMDRVKGRTSTGRAWRSRPPASKAAAEAK
jgi:hypothetical protein